MLRLISRTAALLALASAAAACTPAYAQVVHVGELNTRQIAALDRARTVVVLQGGMLEEHGPYLPAFTDGILSARLAALVARGIAEQVPGTTVLVFPPISIGASGYNEIGGHYTFAGTYAIRPSTLRSLFMDLAADIGDQGFRRIFVVHVHGSPLHIGAIDDAGDWFQSRYGGTMVNLWGLIPVLAGWGRVLGELPDSTRREDGASLHAGLDEHSLMLFLAPELVAADYRNAPTVSGSNQDSAVAAARRPDWPGYLGAPRLASRDIGERIWNGFSNAAAGTAVEIVRGAEPARYQRYMTFLRRNPNYQNWIRESERRDSIQGEGQASWLRSRPR